LTVTRGLDPRVQRPRAVDGRSNGQPRPHATEGAAARGGARRRVADDDQNKAPGHEIVREKHLRAAGNKTNLTKCSHGRNGRQPRRGVHGGGRPAAGKRRRRYGRAQVKRRAGIVSLHWVGALVAEDWMGKAATVEFNTGGGGVQHRRRRRASIGAHEGLRVR
jgi:hypothetical protein